MRCVEGLNPRVSALLLCVMFAFGGILGSLLFFRSALAGWEAGGRLLGTRITTEEASELQQAKAELKKGNTQAAVILLRKLVQHEPKNSEAYFLLGEVFADNAKWAPAAAAFKRALELNPSSSDASIRLGEVQLQSGNIRQAISTFKGALYLNTDDERRAKNQYGKGEVPAGARVYNGLGLAFHSTFRHNKAENLYLKALHEAPYFAEVYNNLAVVYAENKQYTAAKEALHRALTLEPALVEAWHNLSLLGLERTSREAALYCETVQRDNTQEVSTGRAEIISGGRRYVLEGNGVVRIMPHNGARVTEYVHTSYKG